MGGVLGGAVGTWKDTSAANLNAHVVAKDGCGGSWVSSVRFDGEPPHHQYVNQLGGFVFSNLVQGRFQGLRSYRCCLERTRMPMDALGASDGPNRRPPDRTMALKLFKTERMAASASAGRRPSTF